VLDKAKLLMEDDDDDDDDANELCLRRRSRSDSSGRHFTQDAN
jgi:hypothetical protein